uniref:Uncharacterized protein n=1 Tax=Heterorhabditis bacteriophora TaxID=37862 RepID=A0A1I7WGC6_HETBA
MVLVNITQCNKSEVPTSTFMLLLAQNLQRNAAEIRELKHFYILPPKVQIKILTEVKLSWKFHYLVLVATLNSPSHTSMNIFQDMKYLIEREFILLNRQFVPGAFKLTTENMRRKETASFGDISRIFAH